MLMCCFSISMFIVKLQNKYSILVLESKNHIGGNCYDYIIKDGFITPYGPHIFHTNNDSVFDFLSQYTQWNTFKYVVKSEFIFQNKKEEIHFPISSLTKEEFNYHFNEEEILSYFFKDYSEKMWGEPFDQISSQIINKIPLNYDKEYSYSSGRIVNLNYSPGIINLET